MATEGRGAHHRYNGWLLLHRWDVTYGQLSDLGCDSLAPHDHKFSLFCPSFCFCLVFSFFCLLFTKGKHGGGEKYNQRGKCQHTFSTIAKTLVLVQAYEFWVNSLSSCSVPMETLPKPRPSEHSPAGWNSLIPFPFALHFSREENRVRSALPSSKGALLTLHMVEAFSQTSEF